MDRKMFEDIMEIAIRNEIQAAEFYTRAAEKFSNTFIKELFTDLAAEEQKHRKTLENLKTRDSLHQVFKETNDYKVSETVEEPEVSENMTPADAIALAMKKEEEAMNYYATLAKECNDPQLRETLLELSTMEQGHKTRMEQAFLDVGYPEAW